MSIDDHDHDALNCPQCQAASQACRVIGSFAEALAKMLEDGTVERLGAKMAYEREKRALEAITGKLPPEEQAT